LKKNNIIGYILRNDPGEESVEEVQEEEEEMEEREESENEGESMEVEKIVTKDKEKKVFLFNTSFDKVEYGEKKVDLLITDIPYNVSNNISFEDII